MGTITVRQKLATKVAKALDSLYQDGTLTGDRLAEKIVLGDTKHASHGDFACNAAMMLTKKTKRNPREIATALQERLGTADGMLDRTEIAGPGFLNLFVSRKMWHEALAEVLRAKGEFLRSDVGGGNKILLEYVSANPTGPLHIAHGRGAVTGDILARLLDAAGYQVHREYYVNDLGAQVDTFGRSIYLRYAELHGRPLDAPEAFYPGEYVIEIAQELKNAEGDKYLDQPEEQWLHYFRDYGVKVMLERIKKDLRDFGITFDRFVSEREMTERTGLKGTLDKLEQRGVIYEREGKRWFRSTDFGDDKDRVVIREDGRTTYFASDIAYHDDKLSRGYRHLINVWGADHGGYIQRVKAGIAALGWEGDPLEVRLVQMVALLKGGEPFKIGKRTGNAIWLRDVLDAAGKDPTRFFFALRRSESQMELDIDLATKKTLDNPVYYAQMGHARLCAIFRKAAAAGVPAPTYEPGVLDVLTLPEELTILQKLAKAPEVVAQAAIDREPHAVVHYLQDLIGAFHSYYTQYSKTERVISDDAAKTRARLLLCAGLRDILRAALVDILGVSAPEEMYLEEGAADDLG